MCALNVKPPYVVTEFTGGEFYGFTIDIYSIGSESMVQMIVWVSYDNLFSGAFPIVIENIHSE